MSKYRNEDFWSDDAQQAVKKSIAELLDDQNLFLITGAGLSNNFGYPMWGKFLDDLNDEIGSPVNKTDPACQTNGDMDYLKYAQAIVDKIQEHPSQRYDLKNFVFNQFHPRIFKNTKDFYKNFIELGFQGFATLNYDPSLELLIENYHLANRSVNPINVCNDDCTFEIKTFLDNVTQKKEVFSNVLHLHGFYKEPSKIILTQSSYDDWYNKGSPTEVQKLTEDIIDRTRKKGEPIIEEKLTELLSRIRDMFDSRTLNSRHKKLIWLIFARHRILFIGFSADDNYFMNLLDIVKDDFTLPSKPIHYILLEYTPDKPEHEYEEKEKICERLVKKGVWPIFYPVVNDEYEAGLEKFVREIESLKKIVNGTNNQPPTIKNLKEPRIHERKISDITREMLRLK